MAYKKTALITGSSRGIGLGLVKEYIQLGYKVFATCRTPEKAKELSLVLAENGQRPPLTLDVTSIASIEDCKKVVAKETNQLEVLVNNAGISNKDHPGTWPMSSLYNVNKQLTFFKKC